MTVYNFSGIDEAIDYLLDNTDRGLIMDRKHMMYRQDYNSYLIVEVKASAAYIVYDNAIFIDGKPDFEEVDFTYAMERYF